MIVQQPNIDYNVKTEDGDTLGHAAVRGGDVKCAETLTGRVDWNKGDNWGQTPLYCALREGHSDIVEIIVQQPNIDYNVKTERGVTLGHAAVRGGNVKCVETLAAQERCDCWNVEGNTPLMNSVRDQRGDLCKILLKCPRVNVNLKNLNGEDVMTMARQAGNTEIVKMLEDFGRIKRQNNKKNEGTNDNDYENHFTLETSDIKGKISRIQDVIEANEKLKTKIKEKECEIKELKNNLKINLKIVDNLMREGIVEVDKEDFERTEKQTLISFLTKSIEDKKEAIRVTESELECPVCLETAGGEIFCCVEQHLVCSQCRPRVMKCPQCRQSYPPTPIRHRYAEKMVGELERLREELARIVVEIKEMTYRPSAPKYYEV